MKEGGVREYPAIYKISGDWLAKRDGRQKAHRLRLVVVDDDENKQ